MATTDFITYPISGELLITEALIPYVYTALLMESSGARISTFGIDSFNYRYVGVSPAFDYLIHYTTFKRLTLEEEQERWKITTYASFYITDTSVNPSVGLLEHGQPFTVWLYVYYINPEGKYELRKFKA